MTIFTKIINRELPGYILEENQHCIAFLDIQPIKWGHTLVVPKKEIDYLFDLEETDYLELQKFAKQVSQRLREIVSCQRIGVAVVGLEVPHTHIHLVPIDKVSDINFSNPKLSFSEEDYQRLVTNYQKGHR
ncbi:uncharacterized HIT-like protein Mb0782c [Ylistrum balloti]|uniref:uncharacterized HIT-like protein Mb0782c n=1 Tax=Ylistrum balloti TaxID=509963 RepID=UPI0029059C56|nr:uncharacterized HIT-like protein Mb0782c [Ylistrum balloti]